MRSALVFIDFVFPARGPALKLPSLTSSILTEATKQARSKGLVSLYSQISFGLTLASNQSHVQRMTTFAFLMVLEHVAPMFPRHHLDQISIGVHVHEFSGEIVFL